MKFGEDTGGRDDGGLGVGDVGLGLGLGYGDPLVKPGTRGAEACGWS